MRLIIRNFIRIFQRFRLAMTLNILGLSIAFVAFMLLIMQWSYDQEFDTHDPNADYIYRINSDGGDRGELAIISRPLAEIINQSSPPIFWKDASWVPPTRKPIFPSEKAKTNPSFHTR